MIDQNHREPHSCGLVVTCNPRYRSAASTRGYDARTTHVQTIAIRNGHASLFRTARPVADDLRGYRPAVDDLQALELAGRSLERRLAAVQVDVLQQPSSCSGWSVYDLINHVNGGGHRYLLLSRGAAAAEVDATRTH